MIHLSYSVAAVSSYIGQGGSGVWSGTSFLFRRTTLVHCCTISTWVIRQSRINHLLFLRASETTNCECVNAPIIWCQRMDPRYFPGTRCLENLVRIVHWFHLFSLKSQGKYSLVNLKWSVWGFNLLVLYCHLCLTTPFSFNTFSNYHISQTGKSAEINATTLRWHVKGIHAN